MRSRDRGDNPPARGFRHIPADTTECHSAEGQTIERELKSAAELKGELDWAISVLLGADVAGRIAFDEPILVPAATAQYCNWDVNVCCSPDDDDMVQTAIRHVADRWDLA
jgi:hypothetical protein